MAKNLKSQKQTIIYSETEPWWLSWLERQSHDNLSILKVEGSNRSFLGELSQARIQINWRSFRGLMRMRSSRECSTAHAQNLNFWMTSCHVLAMHDVMMSWVEGFHT